MKLAMHGYTESTVKKYEMSMGDLILTISQALIAQDKMDIEIRMVDCLSGEVDRWAGVKGLLTHDWPADWRVTVYRMELMHNNKEEYDYLKILFSDDIEML